MSQEVAENDEVVGLVVSDIFECMVGSGIRIAVGAM